MARKLLIGLGVLVALLVVALIALVTLVDVNRFKPQIAQAVQDRFNRTLVIDGDLSLTLFPRIGVALPKTTLSEHRGPATFASLDGARVSVALLPLLSGRIEAGTVSVYGLTATIDKRADGTTNVDDLLKGDAAATPTTPTKDAGGPPQFEIGGIELANANLTYRDLAAKNTVTLTQFNLTTGRLATTSRTPVDLSTRFAATAPAAQGELSARGELDLDLVKQAFGARGLNLTLKATLEQRPVDVSARAGELRYDGASGALSITKLDATAQGTVGTTQLEQARIDVPALAWDPRSKRLSVGGVQVTARGKLGADARANSFEVELAAPKIDVTETAATGERVTAGVKLGGAQRIDAKLTLEGLSGSAKDLKIGKLSIAADVVQPINKERSRHIVAQLSSPVSASIDAQTVSLPKIAGDITMEDPALPQKSVKLPITASFTLDALKEVVAARLLTKFDETTLGAEFDVRGFATPRLAFDASADKLNLDRYFPPTPPRPGNDSADPAEDPVVDLSALKSLNLTGQAQVGQLQARGIKVQTLRVALKAGGGRLDVAPLTAALYGGSVNASAFAQADNRVGLDAALTNVNIEPLMKDAIDKDLLAGRGNVKLDIRTGGATVNGMKRGLNGSGAVALRDGAVKGINVAQMLRNARSLLAGGQTETKTGSAAEKTDFSEMTASFAIKDGIARNDDLDLKSPLIRVGGAGQVDVPAGTLDYTVKASVVGTLKGQDGRDINELRGVTVPVKLSGPFEKIGYSIDWGAAAQDALKSRATEQVKEKLQPKVDEQRKKIEERAKDALKGLFGR
jgi:AsmA protein